MLGSPLYMSPEQMRSSRDVDARSDVWALGVVLFELLTQRWPFEAETMPELCLKVVTEPPQSLAELRPDAPPAMVEVVERCLKKDPAERFANAAELASALEPLAPPESRVTVERARLAMAATGREAVAELTRVLAGCGHPGAYRTDARGMGLGQGRGREGPGSREKASGRDVDRRWLAAAAAVVGAAVFLLRSHGADPAAGRSAADPGGSRSAAPAGDDDPAGGARRTQRRGRSCRSGDDRRRLRRPSPPARNRRTVRRRPPHRCPRP